MPFGGMLTAGASVLGAGGSIAGGITADRAAKRSENLQKGATQNALMGQNALNRLQEQYGEPYADIGLDYLPLLDYLTTGRIPEIQNLSAEEAEELAGLLGQQNELRRNRELYSSSSTGSRSSQRAHAGRVNAIDAQLSRLADLQGRQRQADAYGRISSGDFLQESPLYRWQQEQGEKSIDRSMAARGLYGSSAATNALSNFQRGLGAEESERQYGRVAGMVDMGRGGANSYMSNRSATAGNTGNLAINLGNNLSQNALRAGDNRSSMFQSLGELPMNAMETYRDMQLADAKRNYYNRGNPFASSSNPMGLTRGQGL